MKLGLLKWSRWIRTMNQLMFQRLGIGTQMETGAQFPCSFIWGIPLFHPQPQISIFDNQGKFFFFCHPTNPKQINGTHGAEKRKCGTASALLRGYGECA